MDVWERLTGTAVLGTARQPVDLSADGPLGTMLAKLQGQDAEHQLLGAAAMVSLYRRAGTAPPVNEEPLPVPAAVDDRPACPPRARECLAVMLGGQHAEVLPEWLALLKQSDARVPEEHLPALLEIGSKKKELREAIAAVAGGYGRWLAAGNPAWRYLLALIAPDSLRWEDEEADVRVELLKRLRATDPDRARELVQSTWGADTPKDRAAFLETFRIGLSMGDEPFLESALDDKRKEVRSAAADLLACLPESRLVKRMQERLESLLIFTPAQPMKLLPPSPAKKAKVTVNLATLQKCDKAMTRDGLDAPSQYGGFGNAAWWLLQMVGRVPPACWTARWGLTPADVIAATEGDEFRRSLLEGWAQAAVRTAEVEWALALVPLSYGKNRPITLTTLYDLLRPVPLDRWIESVFTLAQELQYHLSAEMLFEVMPAPWDVTRTTAVLKLITRGTASIGIASSNKLYILIHTLVALGIYAHPSCFSHAEREAQGLLDRTPSGSREFVERNVQNCLMALQLRTAMYRAFGKETQ